MHREENVDNPQILRAIISILNQLAAHFDLPVIVTTHPRSRKRIKAIKDLDLDKRISFLKPFGFLDYVKLQKNALCVISDSGTISEESSILGFPAITLRNSMERSEALDAGSIIITGFNTDIVMSSSRVVIDQHKENNYSRSFPTEYFITDTSKRVLNLILGTTMLSNKWAGVK